MPFAGVNAAVNAQVFKEGEDESSKSGARRQERWPEQMTAAPLTFIEEKHERK